MLTNENYFSIENRKKYMGVSQFKAFEKCEAAALAEVNGVYNIDLRMRCYIGVDLVIACAPGEIESFKIFKTIQLRDLFCRNNSFVIGNLLQFISFFFIMFITDLFKKKISEYSDQ